MVRMYKKCWLIVSFSLFSFLCVYEVHAKSMWQEFADNIAVARNWKEFAQECSILKRQCVAPLSERYNRYVLKIKQCIAYCGLIHNPHSDFENFCFMHRLPEGILTKNMCEKGNDIRRIINADRMRACIAQYKLNRLHVPYKYLVKKEDGYHVYAERIINHDPKEPLSLQVVQQLTTLVEKTGYIDLHPGNIFFDEQGDVYLIDTEDRSFGMFGKGFGSERCFNGLQWYFTRSCAVKLAPDALEWFNQRKMLYTQNQTFPFLPTNNVFDSQMLSMENVKKVYDAACSFKGHNAIHYA